MSAGKARRGTGHPDSTVAGTGAGTAAVAATDPCSTSGDIDLCRAIWALASEAIVVVNLSDGRFEAVNPAARVLLGLPAGEGMHPVVADVFEDGGEWLERLAAVDAARGSARVKGRVRQHGSVAPLLVELDVAPLTSPDLRRACLIVREIPPPAPATADLDRAQRLESIGLLAGGIAHDFNNLLTGILGQVSLALALLPADSPARTPINKAAGAAGRAADLTRQLLAYAGRGAFRIETLDLNTLIIENIGLLETILAKGVRLQLDLDQALPAMEADRGQIQQVLMNLALNAGEAVGERSGRVSIRTSVRSVARDDPFDHVGPETLAPGPYIALEVADTGVGMAAETIAHIFEPFFSTKGDGRGLGLSATLGIIRSHGGALSVESDLDVGTCFRVLFPVAAGAAASERVAAASVGPGAPPGPRSRVLVIDDEPAVREATVDMLEAAGHAVLTAIDGRDGVACFAELGDHIDVVLLDMKMPVMDGEQALQALRRLDPGVNVVVMTGYSEAEAVGRFGDKDVRAFLQKPFDYATLVAVVEAALA